jgi:hypothetical protein
MLYAHIVREGASQESNSTCVICIKVNEIIRIYVI